LKAIAASLGQRESVKSKTHLQQPWLVTIALDGENCWENYTQDGLPFLTRLYEQFSYSDQFKLVTVSEFLDQFPPTHTIPRDRLHTGSWIDGTLKTWIGDPIKNKAWDYLIDARQVLANHPEATVENNPEVWEALYAAEGSDWFWWFGEGHSSHQDEIFDQLFREHLCTLYRALNEPIPNYLYQPLEKYPKKAFQQPEAFIHPIIDGIGEEEEWEKAGQIEISGAKGTMHQNTLVQRLYYGVNHQNFYCRLNFRADFKANLNLKRHTPNELHLFWYYPGSPRPNSPAAIAGIPDEPIVNYYFHHHLGINLLNKSVWLEEVAAPFVWHPRHTQAQVAFNECLELALPWSDLQKEPNTTFHLIAMLADQGEFHSYLPEDNLILVQIP
jgi:alpha-amylase/alpha-mannosidase (GH57 family)